MPKLTVRVVDREIVVHLNEVERFTLSPDEAMDLGVKLLRAAYATRR